MKVSEITADVLADYLRLYESTEDEKTTLENLLNIAKAYTANYTGHTVEDLDNYPDFTIVVMVLVQNMYDNRTLYVDNSNLNVVVETILGMHSVNLL